jgi:hypothetical protein
MELDPSIHIGITWFVMETECDISIVPLTMLHRAHVTAVVLDK